MGLAAIAGLLPIAVRGIVMLIDRIKGDGTGAEKKPLAVDIVKLLFENLQKSTPGLGLPQSAAEIGKLVEDTVARLNGEGKLKGFATIVGDEIDSGLMIVCAAMLEQNAKRLRALAGSG